MNISQEHIILFKSFFRGRNDVYAVRWEKDGKSGYMPDYKVDWSDYKEHKAGGGSFKDYKKKEYLPFGEDTVLHHFEGRKTVGIYPLLEDNTSYFIAADFDEANWKDSILKLHSTCQKSEIPAYIERSRSGKGGHLWIFFEENLPAEQTRKLMFELLKEARIISPFEKEPSFDKLETITIHGDDSEQSRKSKLEQLKQGHFKIVISTGQYFGEGVDLDSLECLFIVYPFAFEGKLIQYIGRIQRSGKPVTIFDYRDSRIDYFDKMFMQRNRYYKKLMK